MIQTVADGRGRRDCCSPSLWAAREALMLIYVSALIAMGFSPLVRLIERPRSARPRRVPRWLAILAIYLAIVGSSCCSALMVDPAARRAGARRCGPGCPAQFNTLQTFLDPLPADAPPRDARGGGAERAERAPAATRSARCWSPSRALIGGVFGLITILILSFYLLIEARADVRVPDAVRPGGTPRATSATAARQAVDKGQRVAARAVHARRRDGRVRGGRARPDGRAVLLRRRADRGDRRDDSDRRPDHRRHRRGRASRSPCRRSWR